MFSAWSRVLLHKAPIALSGAATLAASQSFRQPLECDANQVSRKPSGVRQDKGTFPIDIGKKFLQLYFAEFADTSGKICLHSNLDLAKATTMLQAAGCKPKQCKEVLDLMDTDGSGTVDFEMIMVFMLNHGKGSIPEKGSLFFHACDIDGSGSVEFTELKDVVHHMMLLRREEEGIIAFTGGQQRLYNGIPATYILHYQANELVNDIFTSASKGEHLTEKQFQTWLARGGKQVERLLACFGM